jgi:uncharacterized RDD family membrane protein YckC
MIVYCSKCGSENDASAAFCQKCGASLAIPLAPVPPVVVAPAAPVVVVATVSPYAGFWIRVLATIIDRVILGVVLSPLFFIYVLPAIIKGSQGGFDEDNPHFSFTIAPTVWIIASVVCWAYEAVLTSSEWQGTVGKRVLGLKVTDLNGKRISLGRSTGRFFAKILSFAICYIGVIMVAFTERKQGLHDTLAGTLVWKGR